MIKLFSLLIVFLLSFESIAQTKTSCASFIKFNQADSSYHSKQPIIISDDGMMSGFSLSIHLKNDTLKLSFEPFGKGVCLTESSNADLRFTDGSLINLIHQATDTECDAILNLSIPVKNGPEPMAHLTTKMLSVIRINGKENYLQTSLLKADAMDLKNMFGCLADQLAIPD